MLCAAAVRRRSRTPRHGSSPGTSGSSSASHAVQTQAGPRQQRNRCQPGRKDGSSIETDGTPYLAVAGFSFRPHRGAVAWP
jgi:hypothetical protein